MFSSSHNPLSRSVSVTGQNGCFLKHEAALSFRSFIMEKKLIQLKNQYRLSRLRQFLKDTNLEKHKRIAIVNYYFSYSITIARDGKWYLGKLPHMRKKVLWFFVWYYSLLHLMQEKKNLGPALPTIRMLPRRWRRTKHSKIDPAGGKCFQVTSFSTIFKAQHFLFVG